METINEGTNKPGTGLGLIALGCLGGRNGDHHFWISCRNRDRSLHRGNMGWAPPRRSSLARYGKGEAGNK
jgi:hypothetical protein